MAKFLVATVSNLTQSDVFVKWPGGILDGLFKQRGLFDSTPLKNFIANMLETRGGIKDRKVVVGATDLNLGTLQTWNETDPEFAIGTLASASIPGAFPFVSTRGSQFGDGGVINSINVLSAIERCLEIVDDPADIVLDMISCHTYTLNPVDPENDKTLEIAWRALDIINHHQKVDDITDAKRAYPTVQYRYNISPTQKLPGNMLDFNHTILLEMAKIGYSDAVKAINANH
jgi:predicted patatin/cPLA2 family phospholipase